jgi:hypothetical protein
MSLTQERPQLDLLDEFELCDEVPEAEVNPDLLRLTRAAYPWPKWALMTEIPSQPGFYAPRRIDAMAMGMWQSDLHKLIAFEFKVSRGDWLRELRQPEKCREALKLADAFFLVCPPGVAKREEIPAGWGWLEVEGGGRRLRRRVHPATRTPEETCGRGLAAMLVRRACEAIERERLAERRNIRKEETASLRAEIEAEIGAELPRLRDEVKRLRRPDGAVWRALGVCAGVLDERGRSVQWAIRDALVASGLAEGLSPYQRECREQEAR